MARKKKGKIEKQQVFIFVEGQTEYVYFERLKQILRLPNLKITTKLLDNTGDWIEKTKRKIENDKNIKVDKNSLIYIVFDRDDIEIYKFNDFIKKANKQGYKLGFSNIAFEVWLLAHFEKITESLLTKSQLKNKLSTYLNNEYKKADYKKIYKIVDYYRDAIENTKDVCNIDINSQSTNIGNIILELRT